MDNDNFGNNERNIFDKNEHIGSGTYGVVYKGINKKSNETIAIKKIKIDLKSEGIPSTALREISILRELKHNNIVELKDVVCSDNKLYLIFEYLEIDLRKYLESLPDNEFLEPDIVKSLIFQILEGVAYCHSKKIIHRDLKPQNLLLNQVGRIKIADFGLARAFSIPIRPYTKEVLTLWYRSPEILLGCEEYSTPVDIWSVGCIFAELILKRPLFQGEYDLDQLFKIFKYYFILKISVLGTPDKDSWPEVNSLPYFKDTFPKFNPKNFEDIIPSLDQNGINLLSKLLYYDPNKRVTAKQALLHVYINFLLI
jgi:serine/threonine protein kinase